MIRVRYAPEAYALTAVGHAGAGPAGQDLVCAAASALMQTLESRARSVPAFRACVTREAGTPLLSVRCAPEEEAREACRATLETVLAGLSLLASRYPAHVSCEIIHRKGKESTP